MLRGMKKAAMVTAAIVLTLCIQQVWTQDEGENPNMRLGENPYMFLYYDLEEKLDDFYDTREKIKTAANLLRQGKGVPIPDPNAPAPDDAADGGDGGGDGGAEPDVKPYTGEYEIFVERKAPPLATLLGYLNVTEEDESVWDPTNHIRICLHIWTDDPKKREMVRFVNMNPFFSEASEGNDAAPQDANFIAQMSTSTEEIDDPLYWCSRKVDWSGVNKDLTSFNNADLETFDKNTVTYTELETSLKYQAQAGNYWIGSQLTFIEDKSDGLGLDYLPTVFWVKQSASVAFRRKLDNSEVPGSLEFKPGKTYKVLLQYGLFNNNDDQEKTKVKGGQTWDEAKDMLLQTTIKEYIPYTKAHALRSSLAAILIGFYCSLA